MLLGNQKSLEVLTRNCRAHKWLARNRCSYAEHNARTRPLITAVTRSGRLRCSGLTRAADRSPTPSSVLLPPNHPKTVFVHLKVWKLLFMTSKPKKIDLRWQVKNAWCFNNIQNSNYKEPYVLLIFKFVSSVIFLQFPEICFQTDECEKCPHYQVPWESVMSCETCI